MMQSYENLLDRQMTAILPGNEDWPPYARDRSLLFWSNWRASAPMMTRFGLFGCVLVIAVYSWLMRAKGRARGADRYAMQEAASSRSFLVRQSVTLLKLVATLAYFSDPAMQEVGRRHPEAT